MTSWNSSPIPILFAYLFVHNNLLDMLNISVYFLIESKKSPLPFKGWKLKISLIAWSRAKNSSENRYVQCMVAVTTLFLSSYQFWRTGMQQFSILRWKQDWQYHAKKSWIPITLALQKILTETLCQENFSFLMTSLSLCPFFFHFSGQYYASLFLDIASLECTKGLTETETKGTRQGIGHNR